MSRRFRIKGEDQPWQGRIIKIHGYIHEREKDFQIVYWPPNSDETLKYVVAKITTQRYVVIYNRHTQHLEEGKPTFGEYKTLYAAAYQCIVLNKLAGITTL